MTENNATDAQHQHTVDQLLGVADAKAAPPKPATTRAETVDGESIEIPPMTPIEGSSQLEEFGYCADTGHLFLRFRGKGRPGTLYRYPGFGLTDLQAFADAESKGSYFAKSIKTNAMHQPCERIDETRGE